MFQGFSKLSWSLLKYRCWHLSNLTSKTPCGCQEGRAAYACMPWSLEANQYVFSIESKAACLELQHDQAYLQSVGW